MNTLPGQISDNSIGHALEPQRAFHDLRQINEFQFPQPKSPKSPRTPEVVDVGCFCGFRSVKKSNAKTR